MENYTFDHLIQDLNSGYNIYFTYMDNRYILSKVAENAYAQELLTIKEKSPHPKMNIISLKVIKENFKHMTDFEYAV